jgi:predicted dehydrogenase
MRHHLRQGLPAGVEVVGLCDPDAGQLAATAGLCPSPTFTSLEELLDEVKPDAVFIASPHADHCAQTLAAFQAGCHVLLEKPISISVAEADRMIAARDASGLVAGLAYQRHGQPIFRWLKAQIEADAWGELLAITCHLGQPWKRFTEGSWRQRPEIAGGGMLHDSGSHMVDIALWATGRKPTEVTARIDNRGTPVDIHGFVSARLDNGATLQVSVVGDAAVWHERHAYWFAEAAVFIEDDVVRVVSAEGVRSTIENWPVAESPLANFAKAVAGDEPVYAPFECGRHVQAFTEGAYQSAETGQPCSLA